jgi:hypothetical protein
LWYSESNADAAARGGGNGGFGNGEADMHIAEIDDTENAAGQRPWWRDEGIMIVGIAVNYATAKVRETRERFGFEEP